jgi:ribokinase
MNDVEVQGILKRVGLTEINALLDLGPAIVIVIGKKDKSSSIWTREGIINIPSALRKITDPTGATDGYIGAFLTAYIKGYNIKTAGMLGAVEASFVAENFGSQTNLPSWNHLHRRYRLIFGIPLKAPELGRIS